MGQTPLHAGVKGLSNTSFRNRLSSLLTTIICQEKEKSPVLISYKIFLEPIAIFYSFNNYISTNCLSIINFFARCRQKSFITFSTQLLMNGFQNAYVSMSKTPPSPHVSIRKHFPTPSPLKNAYVICGRSLFQKINKDLLHDYLVL